MRKIIIAGIFIVLAFLSYLLIKNIIGGEEGRLKRLIYSAKRAVERQDLIKSVSFISFNYKDKYGNDRGTLLMLCKMYFQKYDDIYITIKELKIKIEEKRASADIKAVVLEGRKGELGKKVFEYDNLEFKVVFQKEEAGWKVIELEFFEPEDVIVPGMVSIYNITNT